MTHPDPVGQKIREAFSALDDLMVLANQEETREQFRAEKIAIGQLYSRCSLLASFALIKQPDGLRLVHRTSR